jgi:hypothetical protein
MAAAPCAAMASHRHAPIAVAGIPAKERERIAACFRVQEQRPDGQEGKILETGTAAAARTAVDEALSRYRRAQLSGAVSIGR